jgi:hypothetical protein
MLKLTVLAAVSMVGLALVTGASAAESDPNNGPNDACMKSAYDLADEAEKKQLSDSKLEKLDGMFNTMEKHCKALELPQAQSMAAQIKTLIDTGN